MLNKSGSVVFVVLFVVSLLILAGAVFYNMRGNNQLALVSTQNTTMQPLTKGDSIEDIQTDLNGTSFDDIDSSLNSAAQDISSN